MRGARFRFDSCQAQAGGARGWNGGGAEAEAGAGAGAGRQDGRSRRPICRPIGEHKSSAAPGDGSSVESDRRALHLHHRKGTAGTTSRQTWHIGTADHISTGS